MTRWGLLADIHGNLPMLQAALAEFERRGVQQIAVLGDNLGRGASESCVELLQRLASVSVVGNRDLDWQDRVSADARAYVLGLPRQAQVGQLLFSHGDGRLTPVLSSAEIRRGFSRARTAMLVADATVWAFGHTHRARVWRLDTGKSLPSLLFDAAADPLPARIALPATVDGEPCRWVVNVGSVGLPFPGKGPASAAVLELPERGDAAVEFFRLAVSTM